MNHDEKVFSLAFSEPKAHPLQSGPLLSPSAEATEQSSKPGFFDELIRLLKRLLECCLCCLTCGCYPRPKDNLAHEVYEADLLEQEKEAVHDLLEALNSDETFTDEQVGALAVLTYSDNSKLQFSAAGYLCTIAERGEPLTDEVINFLKSLLNSKNDSTRKRAVLAVKNFVTCGPESNKSLTMISGIAKLLIECVDTKHPLHNPGDDDVSAVFIALATQNKYKLMLMQAGIAKALIDIIRNPSYTPAQRNATGCVLNLSHLQQCRDKLVEEGVLPVLVETLPKHFSDPQTSYYAAAALSNFAVNSKHRIMMTGIGHHDLLRNLIDLLSANVERVRCQACLALRNLASDDDTQVLVVRLGALKPLHKIVEKAKGECLVAALACLRNLSIHKSNEASIITETFLSELKKLVKDHSNPESQVHSAGIIRNLAAGDQMQVVVNSGCVESLVLVVISEKSQIPVLMEATAALAFLCDEDEAKKRLLQVMNGRVFPELIDLAATCPNADVQYSCAGILGQLSLTGNLFFHCLYRTAAAL